MYCVLIDLFPSRYVHEYAYCIYPTCACVHGFLYESNRAYKFIVCIDCLTLPEQKFKRAPALSAQTPRGQRRYRNVNMFLAGQFMGTSR